MGTWGMHSFENDTASDWVYDLEESTGLSFLEQSVRTEREDGYLDADVGVTAIAAGEVIAALLGRPATKLPDQVTSWVASNSTLDAAFLAPLAVVAIDDVLRDGSELMELWEENEDDFPAWKHAISDLRDRLSATVAA